MLRTHTNGELRLTDAGKTVTLTGWVQKNRKMGGMTFIDLRDRYGITQLVFNQDINPEICESANRLGREYVIQATGTVAERSNKNPNIPTGEIEIIVSSLRVLNPSAVPPFTIEDETDGGDDIRMQYRYLDLRRNSVRANLELRHKMAFETRRYLDSLHFLEVETPVLIKSTPEGARDFVVPSRMNPGQFYALPQSPQTLKQLLMVAGFDRYFQIAKCFRDEDLRADRQPEFTQIDCEMSFVDQDDVINLFEELCRRLFKEIRGVELPKLEQMTWHEAMKRFGSDKPDLRFGMELIELTDVFASTEFGVFKNAECIKAICVKNGASLSRKQVDQFTDIAKSEGAGGLAYITYQDSEAKSPIAKFLSETELTVIKQKTGAVDGDAVFFGADIRPVVNAVLGRLRNEFAAHFNLKDPSVVAFAWIIDFPFYEWDDHGKKLDFGHNPFSMPKGGLEVLESATTDADKLAIVADQFDMVMNGYEICSGGVRNHNPAVLYKVFDLLGFSESYVEEKFGAMLNAFKYGAPPHAGCAFGVDRILMELIDETNVRETLAFPKNGSGVDVMMDSPSTVDLAQLKELGL